MIETLKAASSYLNLFESINSQLTLADFYGRKSALTTRSNDRLIIFHRKC